MGIIYTNKEVNRSSIDCDGTFQVHLALAAEPDLQSNPADIVMILDRSGSMTGSPLENLKIGANTFIDILDETTDGSDDGQIGGGSKIGIVSFATAATPDIGLSTSVAALKAAVDALAANGSTNHKEAFEKALAMFDPLSANQKIMIMFTDGITTIGGDAAPIAQLAKDSGVTIYVIGLNGDSGLDLDALIAWASSPAADFVAITPDEEKLVELFEDLAADISSPGATNIEIEEIINDCFKIIDIDAPDKGVVQQVNDTALIWKIEKLAAMDTEEANLTFTVQRIGTCNGTVYVNESLTYSDDEGQDPQFPDPTIKVDCDNGNCPDTIDIYMDQCNDVITFDANDLYIENGCILTLNVLLRNVCPDKRVALAVILSEVDDLGLEESRGVKFILVPAHDNDLCSDIAVECIRFVLPSSLSCNCTTRHFKARFIANIVDFNFNCCDVTFKK